MLSLIKRIGCSSRRGFLSGSVIENLPAIQEMQKTWVQSLSKEDPLEEGMATHSSILAWRNPWTVESGRLQLLGSQRVRHDLATEHTHLSTHQHRSSLDL